jgi:hypothetical protein
MKAAGKTTATVWKKGGRVFAALGVISMMAACAPLTDQSFWNQATSFANRDSTALGLEQLAAGNYPAAETLFDKALKNNPQDGHALLWRSIVYQNTNRPDLAADGYNNIIQMNPPGTILMTTPTSTEPRPLRDAAKYNLARLKRGLPGSLAMNGAGQGSVMPGGFSGSDSAMAPAGDTMPGGQGVSMPGASIPSVAQGAPGASELGAGDMAVAKRFQILRDLQKAGLVTPEEYAARRAANLGALLPMSEPAPAAYLTAPPPDEDQIRQRMQSINDALQTGAITVQEHVNERTAILDGLLPAEPRERAVPASAPQGLMDAARQISRLEDLQKMKLITPSEFKKERDAIEAAIVEPARATMVSPSSGEPVRKVARATDAHTRTVKKVSPDQVANATPSGGGAMSIHLASYRNPAQAERGWTILSSRFGSELGPLSHTVHKVNLRGKGTFYRLLATDLSKSKAQSICKALKSRGQYCDIKG